MTHADLVPLASVVVAIIAVLGGEASRRASAKASRRDKREDVEREAYQRARAFDVETITRQDRELSEALQRVSDLEGRMAELTAEVRGLRAENTHLRRQLAERTP